MEKNNSQILIMAGEIHIKAKTVVFLLGKMRLKQHT